MEVPRHVFKKKKLTFFEDLKGECHLSTKIRRKRNTSISCAKTTCKSLEVQDNMLYSRR
jgi:hypothetical protein